MLLNLLIKQTRELPEKNCKKHRGYRIRRRFKTREEAYAFLRSYQNH